jgi:hypothetical protein
VSGSTLDRDNAPAWASARPVGANVETIEKRKDAQLCRSSTLNPPELTPSSAATLARAFVQEKSSRATLNDSWHHIGGDNGLTT